jgi:Flp pilus assembly CpaF family ATPase
MAQIVELDALGGSEKANARRGSAVWRAMPQHLAIGVRDIQSELARRRGAVPLTARDEIGLMDRVRHLVAQASRPHEERGWDFDSDLQLRLADDDTRSHLEWWALTRASVLWPLSTLIYTQEWEDIRWGPDGWVAEDAERCVSVAGDVPAEFSAGKIVKGETSAERRAREEARVERWFREELLGYFDIQGAVRLNAASPTAVVTVATPIGYVRMSAAVPPAVAGTSRFMLHVRIPSHQGPQSVDEWERLGGIRPEQAELLRALIRGRCNIMVTGESGAGKTQAVRVLSTEFNPGETVGTAESAPELGLDFPRRDGTPWHQRVMSLQVVPGPWRGAGEILSLREALQHQMKLRPHRIILGEALGMELYDACVAMMSGHSGSVVTMHAGSAAGARHRAAFLVCQAPEMLGEHRLAMELVHRAIDVIVHLSRDPQSGRRYVEEIAVLHDEGGFDVISRTERSGGLDQKLAVGELPDRVARAVEGNHRLLEGA